MANISLEHEDGCARLRAVSGTANALTTAVPRELSSAVETAGGSARGIMLRASAWPAYLTNFLLRTPIHAL